MLKRKPRRCSPRPPLRPNRSRGGAMGRERRCIGSGVVKPETHLVRIALGPEGGLAVDLAARAPGRGAWISPDRALIAKAVKKGLFARAFEAPVRPPEDLVEQIVARLRARCLESLGLARRAGALVLGFDPVREAIRAGQAAWLVEASDGAVDGRDKVLALRRACGGAPPVAGFLSRAALGGALGRAEVVHAALLAGPSARRFDADARRLAGLAPLTPDDWRLGADPSAELS
ncbi:MAG: RNA-binding protein [Maricaulaceae bacterium]